jgi:HAD superfamily hydrolase (TIGR01450 family)
MRADGGCRRWCEDRGPVATRLAALIERYDGLLFDAYGVLVDAAGARAGAAVGLAAVRAAGRPLAVVSNDTSRLPATAAARFASVGLDIRADEIVSPGMLLPGHVAACGLGGARAVVLGNADARAYAAAAGLEVLAVDSIGRGEVDVDAIIVCDDGGFDFLPGMNATLTACVRALDRGRPLALVLANPDLVYPRGGDALGFTAGAMALMLEAALARRLADAPRFVTLGKPAPALFALGRERLGGATRVVMIGDQLETDIAGARAAGIDAALVEGLSVWRDGAAPPDRAPHWLLADLT